MPWLLCPVSQMVSGWWDSISHLPLSPVKSHTLAKPSAMALLLTSILHTLRRACRATKAVCVFLSWYSPWSWHIGASFNRRLRMYPHWSASHIRQLVVSNPSPRISHARARSINIGVVSGWLSPIMQGTCGFMMPAFSAAICARVLPRNSVWSMPILVITLSNGVRILVLSNRPPSPTSITA